LTGFFWRRAASPRGVSSASTSEISAPRVSVVLPLYNHAAYIAEAVQSVLAQGSLLKELIVIDDGSTDASAALMQKLAESDPRIRFEVQSNQGAHATLNTALARCEGEFLAIINSDDAWIQGRLAALLHALDADQGAGMAWSLLTCMDASGSVIANPWYEAATKFYCAGVDLGAALLNGNFMMTTSNLVMRRTVWQAVGPFAPLRYTHDLDWVLRALALGEHAAIVETPLLRYRIHARNTIAEDHTGVRVEWAATAAAYLTLLWDRPAAPPIDWDQAEAIASVLRTHLLDRAVTPCMAYLRREGGGRLDQSGLLGDEDFRLRLAGWV
jgi:glycosyltransferase involved in cell wall biosynthesis